ncbi:HlyC/CorC family transporter [Leucobacter sp. cx-328]|uniref:hemolysin family protein n=1 Tax=unclassified Leucobacter TaxID=2621730 RepID=UPI00165E51DF|nr:MULTISPECIES: hemolysin family protein [unclassified Leucobacter]MBC9944007.1 HlyC/CorC family transporter [Leucobacter sp. cx-328]
MSAGLAALLIIAALLLAAIGGLLAATDAALSVRSRAELLALADEGGRSSKSIRAIAENEESHVNALSFARVFAEVLSAVLITLVLAYMLDELWLELVLATIVMTAVTFVLVGSSPRTVGTHHPDGVIRFTAPTVHAIRVLLGPLSNGLMRFGHRVAPGRDGAARIRDEQQLLSVVDQAAEQAVLEDDDRDLIHSIVELNDTYVREVMVPRIDMVTVSADQSVREALEAQLSSRHSRLPVVGGDTDDIVGVVHLRDASKFVLRRPDEAEASPVTRITKAPVFVPELQRADRLLRQMQAESNHLAFVVDEYGGISGLVTLEDLIEELFGEISDEHDRETVDIVEEGDETYLVSARLPIDRLADLFEAELDVEDVDTVGGLLTMLVGKLPEPGDFAIVEDIRLEAVEVERRRQRLVTIRAQKFNDDEASSAQQEEE